MQVNHKNIFNQFQQNGKSDQQFKTKIVSQEGITKLQQNNTQNCIQQNLTNNFMFNTYDTGQKILPGYNFQSLFRKKSHIRLAKKKKMQQTQKNNMRNNSLKIESEEKQTKNVQKGHWTQQQNKLYHWFLELHNKHFIHKHLRRTDKIFKSMAHFIRSRQAEQCRSHHQKMQKKYQSFYKILVKLRQQFYTSMNPDIVKSDLEENGYNIRENLLITQSELKHNNDNIKIEAISEQENQQNQCRLQDEESDNMSDAHRNLLGENYEDGFNFMCYDK